MNNHLRSACHVPRNSARVFMSIYTSFNSILIITNTPDDIPKVRYYYRCFIAGKLRLRVVMELVSKRLGVGAQVCDFTTHTVFYFVLISFRLIWFSIPFCLPLLPQSGYFKIVRTRAYPFFPDSQWSFMLFCWIFFQL